MSNLNSVISDINKRFGANTITNFEEVDKSVEVACSTGSIGLDKAIGIGGLPRGRIIEIFGPESSGKTTIALHCLADIQKRGKRGAFIDMEHALDPIYAKAIGINISKEGLIVSQPSCGDEALEIANRLCPVLEVGLIVIDSVAALIPKSELEGEMGEQKVGLQARLMNQAMRKLAPQSGQFGTTIIFINQLREKIGVFYGNPETTTGGMGLKFYSSVRLDVRRIGRVEGEDEWGDKEYTANKTRVKVIKNKVAPPFKEAEFNIVYGIGISQKAEIIEGGIIYEILKETGRGIELNYETPIWEKDLPLNSTFDKTVAMFEKDKSGEYDDLFKDIGLRLKVEKEEMKMEEYLKEMDSLHKPANESIEKFQKYFEVANDASGKSLVVEAIFWTQMALELRPMNKEANNKLKILKKRVEDKISKGEEIKMDVDLEFEGKNINFNLETGEIKEVKSGKKEAVNVDSKDS